MEKQLLEQNGAQEQRKQDQKQKSREGVGWGGVVGGDKIWVSFLRGVILLLMWMILPNQAGSILKSLLNHLRSEKQIIYISLQILLGLKQIIEMQSEHKWAPDSKEEEAMEKLTAP